MKALNSVSQVLVIVGGLNWLLLVLAKKDLGGLILGGMDSTLSQIVYILVGLSAIWQIVVAMKKPSTGGQM